MTTKLLPTVLLALALLIAACAPGTTDTTTPEKEEGLLCAICCSEAGATEERCATARCACAPDEQQQEVPSCAAIQCPVGFDCIDGQGCVEPGTPAAKAPGTACTMEYNPVCGENGITYGNPCMANAEGMTYTLGECPK